MKEYINEKWVLAKRPKGHIKKSDFQLLKEPLSKLQKEEFLVRNIYLSLDPANRGWINNTKSYLPPVNIGEVMRGLTIGVVEESNHPDRHIGEFVQGMLGWQKFTITTPNNSTRFLPDQSLPLSAYFGLFGIVGATAYFGLKEIGNPQKGETLVVSAAAGAVGSLVGQIGKISGCNVVGIAGSKEKCSWIKNELKFDAAINYKTENVSDALKKYCPAGVDVYFDNVGGEITDSVLSLININARIVLCGLISQYNATEPVPGPYNYRYILSQRARLEGFIVLDYIERFDEAFKVLSKWFKEGKLKYRVDVVDGLENAPDALNRLFYGTNKGKLIVKITDEPL